MSRNALLLATLNGEKLIGELLDSLFTQSFSDFRIYVHDDGSTDDTLQILRRYQCKYPERIVLLGGQPLRSAKMNFLWMLSQVEADYYFLCDHDDVWLENKMQRDIDEIKKAEGNDRSQPQLVFSDMYVVDEKLQKLSDSFIRYIGRNPQNIAFTQLLIDNPAAGCTMCFNRALRDLAVGDYEIDFSRVPMHDSYLMEIGAIFGQIHPIDEPLIYYRQTGLNVMGAKTESVFEKIIRNLRDFFEGKTLKSKQKFINDSRFFAREIVKIPGIPEEKKQVLEAFVHIGKEGKLKRMRFYRKNNFTRAQHNFWMRLFV